MRDKLLFIGALGLVVGGCGTETLGGLEPVTNADFAPELNVDLATMTQTPTGLYLQDLVVGTGAQADVEQRVRVHYEAWLANGTKIDSSRERGETFEFVVGRSQVIRGWDEGVWRMREGGLRKLVIPPHLGYGALGVPPTIPGNAWLVFEVELVERIVVGNI